MQLRNTLIASALAVAALAGCQQQAPAEPQADIAAMTDEQKSIYAFGVAVGQQLGSQTKQIRLTPEELELFDRGFDDGMAGKTPAVEIAQYDQQFQQLAKTRLEAGAAEARQKDAEFLAAAEKEPGAVKTGSGLVFRTLTPGQGASPKASDTVRVHYQGTLTDGKVFDSSIQRGEAAEFALNGVIPCWTEGVQLMKVGEKARLVCPSTIAYGERGAGTDIPPNATLVFEVELLEVRGQ
jgi:FKBP-type peptidyl-prolyl cis-trans isomerase FkpA